MLYKHHLDAFLPLPYEVSTGRKLKLEGLGDLPKDHTGFFTTKLEGPSALSARETLPGRVGAERGAGLQVCIIHCSVGFKPLVCTLDGLTDLTQCSSGSPLMYRMCRKPEQISAGQPNSNKTPENYRRWREAGEQELYATRLPQPSPSPHKGRKANQGQAEPTWAAAGEEVLFPEAQPCYSLLWSGLFWKEAGCASVNCGSHPPLGVVSMGKWQGLLTGIHSAIQNRWDSTVHKALSCDLKTKPFCVI